jgi:hypothetical protein
MAEADETKAEVNGLLDIQERVAVTIVQLREDIQQLNSGALLLGLHESNDSNVRPVIQMTSAALSELSLMESSMTEVRGRLLDWYNRL